MISTYDSDYQETKQIMLGLAEMKAEFRPLADWVDAAFGVKTINIVYDFIEEGTRPRLELCFEFEKERNPFYGDEWKNYDGGKQKAIAEKISPDTGRAGNPWRTVQHRKHLDHIRRLRTGSPDRSQRSGKDRRPGCLANNLE